MTRAERLAAKLCEELERVRNRQREIERQYIEQLANLRYRRDRRLNPLFRREQGILARLRAETPSQPTHPDPKGEER